MKTHTVAEIIKPATVKISRENILQSLGVPIEEADQYLINLINGLTDHCRTICTPRVGYSTFDSPVIFKEGTMRLKEHTFSLNTLVASALYGSEEVALFIGTCGSEIEHYSKRLIKDGNSLEGLIVDLIGSEIAEGVAEYIHGKLSSDMELKGWKTTNRYSPGYCNWPVSDQQMLFALMENNLSGVGLTDSSLMIPIKSVSGIIGLGAKVIKRDYGCARCEADHCLYRDKKIHG